MKLDSIQDVLAERLSLGYFYVQNDRIYKCYPTKENLKQLITNGTMPSDAEIVCQDKEIKDPLKADEQAWHHRVKVIGKRRESTSYNNQVETGYL
ncbi:MAG: hypothetical protein ACM3UZ_14140 [Acidobacteriota bacterium]